MNDQKIQNLQTVISDYYKIEALQGYSGELTLKIRELESKLEELLSD